MTKSSQAFRTISEVSEIIGVPAHVLRFWEDKFPQIKPVKRGGGRRYYRPEDIRLLQAIHHLLRVDSYQIRGVQKMLREQGVKAICQRFPPQKADDMPQPTDPDADLWNDVPASGLAEEEEVAPTPKEETQAMPADPARAARMRSILDRLEGLRARMDAHPAPDLDPAPQEGGE
ncbi:MerR family transcriptional regulator [Roseobacter sp. HKCCA0434]|uniref:MerR family transcriptional regulator n=1 Tax=Roseobacter sp. HKCCA0434 TaxID=3079297 RepID=UPI002905E7DE|nr:MerR family transcriptional regulator [Roseobacter sp. HKCCA0434]